MSEPEHATQATVRVLLFWGGRLLLVVLACLILGQPSAQRVALQVLLMLLAVGEGLAGFFYVFSARRMAERSGRSYHPAYHGVRQDFGFYNLGTAFLFALCATDPARNVVVLQAASVFSGLHAIFYRTEQPSRLVCAVAKRLNGEGFLITDYATDGIKEGTRVWPK